MAKGKIEMLPREPLTKKARAAILTYVSIKAEKRVLVMHNGVKWTLEAERMRRADLYEWLESKGYKWLPKYGFWSQK